MCENNQTKELNEIRRRLDNLPSKQCNQNCDQLMAELRECKSKMSDYDRKLEATNRRLYEAFDKISHLQFSGPNTELSGAMFETRGLSNHELRQ